MAATRLTVSTEERTRLAQARLGEAVLGKWRLERLIAVGAMAAVFEAVTRSGNRVAIKILHPDLCHSELERERFLAEGYVANRVAHSGVVAVRDEGTTADGAVFLVTDLLSGQTLAERLLSSHRFSVREVLDIATQLLDVLVHAHGRGIVHRDLKPENVFLTSEGRVKLLDFSVPRGEGSVEHDARGDLWSLGATMQRLLAGISLPRAVVAVVDRALAVDRDERFPDARSMQLAVRAAAGDLSTPSGTVPPLSVEPVAVSLRAPRPDSSSRRLSMSTMRPVATTTIPQAMGKEPPPAGGLSFFVTLGFAVGMGIVVAARLTVTPSAPSMVAAEPTHVVGAAAPAASPSVATAPAESVAPRAEPAPAVAAKPTGSASGAPTKGPSQRRGPRISRPDPLSRRR
jgi:serine/threonine-protein kinase